MPVMMEGVNRAVRGWSHYFHHRNRSTVFSKVKVYVEQRARTHLRKRHKLTRAQAYRRIPRASDLRTIRAVQVADKCAMEIGACLACEAHRKAGYGKTVGTV